MPVNGHSVRGGAMPATNPDIRTVHISELKPDPENARRHNPRNVGQIERSISTDGFGRAGLLAEDLTIAAGNATADAAASVGMEEVIIVDSDGTKPVYIRRTDLKAGSTEFRRLALSDNRAAELADWDADVLQAFLDDGLDLEQFWFPEELAEVLAGDDAPVLGLTDPDEVPAVPDDPITKPGDLWLLGEHRLLCGDSTYDEQVQRVMQGRKADVVFTDPPYGVNVTGKGGDAIAGDISFTAIPLMFGVLPKILAPGAWLYICGGQSNMPLYSRLFEHHFRQLPRVIIWDKGKTAVMRHNGYHSCYEMIYWTFLEGGGGKWFAGRTSDEADDIWRVSLDANNERWHPTQKPVELPARAIRNSCPPGGLVFEPFAGVGSTLLACESLGRSCAAIEMSPAYCDVIVRRWEQFTGLTASRESSEVAA